MAGRCELDDLYGPCQPRPFCDSAKANRVKSTRNMTSPLSYVFTDRESQTCITYSFGVVGLLYIIFVQKQPSKEVKILSIFKKWFAIVVAYRNEHFQRKFLHNLRVFSANASCLYRYGIPEKQDCDSLMQKQLYSVPEVLNVSPVEEEIVKIPSILINLLHFFLRSSISPVKKAQESSI